MHTLDLTPPLTAAGRTFPRYLEGHTYEDAAGVTLYSGAAEPSQSDLEDCLANPRTPPWLMATPSILAEWRYRVENGGVTVQVSAGAHRFDTTRENRSMWLAIQLQALGNPAFTQPWKTLDGAFVTLTAADILAVCAAVYAHVAACFAKEAELTASPIPISALPTAGWPA